MPAQPQVDIVGATDQSLRRASFDGDMGAVKRRCAAGVEKMPEIRLVSLTQLNIVFPYIPPREREGKIRKIKLCEATMRLWRTGGHGGKLARRLSPPGAPQWFEEARVIAWKARPA